MGGREGGTEGRGRKGEGDVNSTGFYYMYLPFKLTDAFSSLSFSASQTNFPESFTSAGSKQY